MSSPGLDALTTATAIASRLADRHTVSPSRERAQSLAGGAAGVALLHIERAHAGHGDWPTAHTWLSAAAHGELTSGPAAGLFFGTPALAFVTLAAADRPGRYERALAALDASTITVTQQRLAGAHARIDRAEQPAPAEYDLISGLTGLGVYHLLRHPGHSITRDVLSYLIRLTEPLPTHTDLPGWWTDLAPTGRTSADFPGGHGNFGISHGISGPLALLSSAICRGVLVPAHTQAIARICDWLDAWRQEHDDGPWWPGFITRDHLRTTRVTPVSRQRPSWCYGTPGLARAQQLAALATGDPQRQRLAETAMLACLRDHTQLDRITGIGLCHGLAGLVHTAWRISADASTPDIATALAGPRATLLDRLHRTPHDADFLDGTPGAALALHTIASGTPPRSTWDACLLLN